MQLCLRDDWQLEQIFIYVIRSSYVRKRLSCLKQDGNKVERVQAEAWQLHTLQQSESTPSESKSTLKFFKLQ